MKRSAMVMLAGVAAGALAGGVLGAGTATATAPGGKGVATTAKGAATMKMAATGPARKVATRPAVKVTWTLQVKTINFGPTADMILKKLLEKQFSGLATANGAIVVTPAERVLLDRLKASTQQVQMHPHDVKLAVKMMTDLNTVAFITMFDSQRSKSTPMKGNEGTILAFLSDVRDTAAASSSVMEVVNIAGSMNHLLTQQTVDSQGDLVLKGGKPETWLSPDKAQDEEFITHFEQVRAKALDILGLKMEGDVIVDAEKTSNAVTTEDGHPVVGLVALKKGKLEKGKVTGAEVVSSTRTTGKVDAAELTALSEVLNDPGIPTARPRYQDFLKADRRLVRDAREALPGDQALTMDVVTFTAGEKPPPVASWWAPEPASWWSDFK